MQLFIHYKIQQVEQLLDRLSVLNGQYQSRSFQLSRDYYAFVDDIINYFKGIGDSVNQAEMEHLKNYFATAEDGIDPETLEKIRTGRRALLRRSAFHCLSAITKVLQQAFQEDQNKLDGARKTLESLILSLVQSEVIPPEVLQQELSQSQVEALWTELTQNDQVKLIERSLKLAVTQEDILLLFSELLDHIKD